MKALKQALHNKESEDLVDELRNLKLTGLSSIDLEEVMSLTNNLLPEHEVEAIQFDGRTFPNTLACYKYCVVENKFPPESVLQRVQEFQYYLAGE